MNEDDRISMWLDNKDLMCSCPKIKLRRKYLVMAKKDNLLKYLGIEASRHVHTEQNDNIVNINYDMELDDVIGSEKTQNQTTTRPVATSKLQVNLRHAGVAGLLVDRETLIIEWRPEFVRRLRRFLKHFQAGKCT